MRKRKTFKVANCDLEQPHADPTDPLIQQIFVVRGNRVMLDRDLAELYGVTTKRLNEQLKRNIDRFPKDFAFQLTLAEATQFVPSRSQIATLKRGHNIKYRPHVFTEHGAIMLASVLNSKVAVRASVHVVRAFVRMRSTLMEYAHLALRIDTLEEQYDESFRNIFAAIRALIAKPMKRTRIGFVQSSSRDRREGERK